jgi:glyoxylase-like metal-dependent hydrolase (beta-lactamase superfamily II)
LPTPFAVGRVNCYAIEDDGLVLVDPGPRSSAALEELEAALAARGHRLEDVDLVLVTHQHHDHTGLAGIVAERSGADIACLGDLARLLADFDAATAADDDYQVALMLLHGVPEETALTLRDISRAFRRFGAGAHVARPLDDGDQVDAGGRRLRVVQVPGHSPTDTLFVHEARGIAFAGDHLLARISSNPVIHRPLAGPDDPRRRPAALAIYLDSLRRTRDLDLSLVLAGHGPPIEDHRALIDTRLREHEARKEEIGALIAERPRTAHELSRAIWGDVALRQAYLTLCEVLGHTDLLAAEGRITETEEGGVTVFLAR